MPVSYIRQKRRGRSDALILAQMQVDKTAQSEGTGVEGSVS